jgi:hypothetical protein
MKNLRKFAKEKELPYGPIAAIYRKGLAAWQTSHRPGVSQHAWAMARVKSVLKGGKARGVDAKEWKAIQKYRAAKRSRSKS